MNLRDMQPEKLSLPHKLVIAVISMSLLAIRVGYYTYPRTVSDEQLVVSHNYSARDVHSFRVGTILKSYTNVHKSSGVLYDAYYNRLNPDMKRPNASELVHPSKPFDFIIAGVKKCGTAALKSFIDQHPQTKLTSLYAFEGHYFDIACLGLSTEECLSQSNRERYLYGPMNVTEGQSTSLLFYETTPAYFTTPGVAARLKQYNPNIKVIIVTCDPSPRALSDYRHQMVQARSSIEAGGLNIKRLFSHQYLNTTTKFEDIVDEALATLTNKTDEEIWSMVVEKHDLEDRFWRERKTDDNTYRTKDLPPLIQQTMSSLSFNPMVKIVFDGLYHIFLASFLKHFELEKDLFIIDNSSLRDDPLPVLTSVFHLLGLPQFFTADMFYKPPGSKFYCSDMLQILNKRKMAFAYLGMGNQYRIEEWLLRRLPDTNLVVTDDKRIMNLKCSSDNAGKSRSTTMRVTPEQQSALSRLRIYYAASRRKLEIVTQKQFNWTGG